MTVEQQFRDALEAMLDWPGAQYLSSGDCMAAAIAAQEMVSPSIPPLTNDDWRNILDGIKLPLK